MLQPLMQTTIGRLLAETAEAYGQKEAFLGGAEALCWQQVEEHSDRIAAALLAKGAGRGSHIGLWAYSTPLFALCFYAIVKIGGVAVLLNTSFSAEEAAYALRYADVELLLVGRGRKGIECETVCSEALASGEFPCLREVLSIGAGSHYPLLEPALKPTPEVARQKQQVQPDDVAAILFTSGTTANPKGAVLTHYGFVNNSRAMSEGIRATADDRYCLALPLFHCFSLAGNLLSCLHTGAALVFLPDRHSIDILTAVQQFHCTILHAVPTLLQAVVNNPRREEFDLSSLRVGILGGAATPPELYRRLKKTLCMRLISSLGQTEATAGVTIAEYDAEDWVNAQTVGKFLDHVEGKLISLTDAGGLPAGETGELCIRGYNVMKGYYRPVSEAAIDQQGWLHTGDLGFLDEQGNLHLVGRRKEIIIRGGENISPSELEACIMGDPRVAEVKCVGVPDEHFGEAICACVVPISPGAITAREVQALVAQRLAHYKVPQLVVLWSELPKTGSGKISRKLICEKLEKEGLMTP